MKRNTLTAPALQDGVLGVVVLADVDAVDKVIRAHHREHTGLHCTLERWPVELHLRLLVNYL